MFKELTVAEQNVILSKFRTAGGYNATPVEAQAAQAEIAESLTLPLRQSVLAGDIVSEIFQPMDFTDGRPIEFPLDLLVPGDEGNYYAYVIPGEGRLPTRRAEADYLTVPTYIIGNAIDISYRLIRNANWNVVNRMYEVLYSGFLKKMNDDGWQTILTAAADRNILVNDPNAAQGQFTPRLITLLSTFMRRNGGGNSGSIRRSRLTNLYTSPEAHMDIRSWGLDVIPDQVRANIYYANENDQDLINIFGVAIKALDELGEEMTYNSFFANSTANGCLNGQAALTALSDVEIVVGLDLSTQDSFVSPFREELQIHEDNTQHRANLFGLYGRAERGWAVLDNRRTLLASI